MIRHRTLKMFERRFRCLIWAAVAPVVAGFMLCSQTQAYAGGLTIDATFDPSLNLAEQGAINAAIGAIESNVTSPNNITVSIYYTATNSGLGESLTSIYTSSYATFYNALAPLMTSPTQMTALASLGAAPGPDTGNPVNGQGMVFIVGRGPKLLTANTPGGVEVNGHFYDSLKLV